MIFAVKFQVTVNFVRSIEEIHMTINMKLLDSNVMAFCEQQKALFKIYVEVICWIDVCL